VKVFVIAALLSAVGLVGCGGGGGSDGASTPASAAPTVTITAANQGTITRAMLDSGQALGRSKPFAMTGGTAARSISSAPIALRTGVLHSVVQRGLVAAFGSRRSASIASATRPAATKSSIIACPQSGSITAAENDADDSQSFSSGDTLTLTFNQCTYSGDDVMSGVMIFTVDTVAPWVEGYGQFSGSLALVQLSSSSGTRLASIQGSVGLAAAIASTSTQIALTVGADALTITSSAPGDLDTIVYEPSMQLTVTATDDGMPKVDLTLNGAFTASSIGGRVVVATVVPLRQLAYDPEPSSGQVVVSGASGTHLRVTALSATSVQFDLDANGDGAYERSGVFAWDSIG